MFKTLTTENFELGMLLVIRSEHYADDGGVGFLWRHPHKDEIDYARYAATGFFKGYFGFDGRCGHDHWYGEIEEGIHLEIVDRELGSPKEANIAAKQWLNDNGYM